nr:hypothetical protein [Treponema sp.]
MDFYDLEPTNENVYQTFFKDKICRNPKVFKFISLINKIESSCSISLDGSWGTGKTIFVKQVKMVLDSLNTFKKSSNFTHQQEEAVKDVFTRLCDKATPVKSIKPHVCVYYDAWENDSDTDPLISLAYKIAKDFSCEYVFKDAPKTQEIVSSALKTIVSRITNIDVNRIYDDCHFTNKLEDIEKTKTLEQTISEMFDSLLPEHGDRLIVFIDELDRCKPTYAVKLLERIKHYFTNQKITFVFSTNILELGNTIKKMYGSDFDADRYFDKFFDLRLSLPEIDINSYLSYLGCWEGIINLDIFKKIIKQYQLSMRGICKFVKIYELAKPSDIALNRVLYSDSCSKGTRFFEGAVLPLLVALQLTDLHALNMFISGKNPKPIIDLLKDGEYPYLSLLNISEMPIFKENGEKSIENVIIALYNKIYNPNIRWDISKFGNNMNLIEFHPTILKMFHESFSLISEFNNSKEIQRS